MERSVAPSDLHLLTNSQPSRISKAVGVVDSLGRGYPGGQTGWAAGGAERRQAGRRLLRNCFHKTCGCCKTLLSKDFISSFLSNIPPLFFLFTALFLGGGGQGKPEMEDSKAPSWELTGQVCERPGEKQGKAAGVFHTFFTQMLFPQTPGSENIKGQLCWPLLIKTVG